MCTRLLRDNLIVKIVRKSRTFILKRFDPHAHCLYHMNMLGHKIEICQTLRHKIHDLKDVEIIIIDLLNQKYEITDPFKVHLLIKIHLGILMTILLSYEILNLSILKLKTRKMSIHMSLKSTSEASIDWKQSSLSEAKSMNE